MRTARSSMRPAGAGAALLLLVFAVLSAAPPAWADADTPFLESPANGSTVQLPASFLVALP